jgi:predicted RND superfamily exporter protein
VGVTAALLMVGVFGASRLEFSHYPMLWLPEGDPFRVATTLIDRSLRGSMDLEVLLETPGVEDGFQDPEVLERLDQLRTYAASLEVNGIRVANTVSLSDVLKETNQALNENRPEYYAVPKDRRLVAQELLLFENSGSDDLEDMVDSRFSKASFTLRIPWVDAIHLIPFIDEVERHFKRVFQDQVQVTMTGGAVVFSRTFAGVIYSMAQSYVLALLIVSPLMILLIGTFRGGLISMIPNLTPIVLTLGMMGWVGFALDFSTMMIGAIVLGVAVDDTIHFLHVFQRNYRDSLDSTMAVRCTLETTGRAILFTSIVLCVGFSSFTLATMKNLVEIGLLTCFAIAAAFLADVLLSPALMVLISPRVTRDLAQKPRLVSQVAEAP